MRRHGQMNDACIPVENWCSTTVGAPLIIGGHVPPLALPLNTGQDQSLESVSIFLSSDAIFSHGQFYVALSRAKNPKGLKVMVCGAYNSTSGGVWISNVVYREVFQNHNINSSLSDIMDLSQMDISLSEISFYTAEIRNHSEDDKNPYECGYHKCFGTL